MISFLSIKAKQNFIYFGLVITVCLSSMLMYNLIQQEWILFRKAEMEYNKKNFATAEALYIKSIDKGMPISKVSLGLAQSYVAQNKFEEAIPFFQSYLMTHPKDADARLALAKVLGWLGRFEEAEEEYQKILEQSDESKKVK